MAEIINFRMARKAKARVAKGETASANRLKFGRSKEAKIAQDLDKERSRRTLDGAKRETD